MVAYYENEAAVIAALKRAKTPQEVIKIAQFRAAYGSIALDTKSRTGALLYDLTRHAH